MQLEHIFFFRDGYFPILAEVVSMGSYWITLEMSKVVLRLLVGLLFTASISVAGTLMIARLRGVSCERSVVLAPAVLYLVYTVVTALSTYAAFEVTALRPEPYWEFHTLLPFLAVWRLEGWCASSVILVLTNPVSWSAKRQISNDNFCRRIRLYYILFGLVAVLWMLCILISNTLLTMR